MSINRLFKLLIALAIVITVVSTVQEAVATALIVTKTNPTIECASLPSRYSIHTEQRRQALGRHIPKMVPPVSMVA